MLKSKGVIPLSFFLSPSLPLSLSLSLSPFFLNIHVRTFSLSSSFLLDSPSHSPKKRESLPRDARLNGGLRHAKRKDTSGGVRAQNNIGMRRRIEKRASDFPLSPTIPFATACTTVIDSVYIHTPRVYAVQRSRLTNARTGVIVTPGSAVSDKPYNCRAANQSPERRN